MRHSTRPRRNFRVRLACVKHAASVQSEPESNSPVQICCKDSRWHGNQNLKVLPTRSSLVNEPFAVSLGARGVSTLSRLACQLLFRFFRKFLFGVLRKLPPSRAPFLRQSRVACQELFCNFATFSRRPVVIPNRRRRTLRRRPLVVKRFFCFFLFFVVLRGEGTPFG